MDDLTIQLQDMFYNALGDEAESERVIMVKSEKMPDDATNEPPDQ